MSGEFSDEQPNRRIFLVEDQPLMRRGLNLLVNFESDLEVCGEAEDADEAFGRIRDLHPDVAIVDLSLKKSNGLDLIPRLRTECPRLRILVVTMHDEIDWIEGALRAGAHGYLTKDESTAQLIAAIRQILEGNQYLGPRVARRLSERTRGSGGRPEAGKT